jgi:hypothetical protein
MRFGPIRSVLTIAIMLILVSVPTSAVKFTAAAGSSAGVASVSGEYKLQDSASLDSDITLDDSVVSRLSSASGSGENTISEGVSGGGKSVTKTIASDGTFSSDSSDFGCGAGAVSDYKTSLSGSRGSINTVSTGKENQMTVAGGFDGEGDMDVSLTSLAAEEALTTGSASALGTPVFSDNLAQGIRGQDMVVCMQGLYLAGDKELGEFGMVAQNTKDVSAAGKPVGKPQPSPVDYILTGYKWQSKGTGPNIPIVLSIDNLPTGITEASAKAQISAAQTEWDKYWAPQLGAPHGIPWMERMYIFGLLMLASPITP